MLTTGSVDERSLRGFHHRAESRPVPSRPAGGLKWFFHITAPSFLPLDAAAHSACLPHVLLFLCLAVLLVSDSSKGDQDSFRLRLIFPQDLHSLVFVASDCRKLFCVSAPHVSALRRRCLPGSGSSGDKHAVPFQPQEPQTDTDAVC